MEKISQRQWRRLGLLLTGGATAVGAVAAVQQIVQSLTGGAVLALAIAAGVVVLACVAAAVVVLWHTTYAKPAVTVALTLVVLFYATAAAFVLGAIVRSAPAAAAGGPGSTTSSSVAPTTTVVFSPPPPPGSTGNTIIPTVTTTTTTTVVPAAFSIDEVAEVPFCSTFTGRGSSPTGHAGLFVQYSATGMPYIFERLLAFPNQNRWQTELPVHVGDQNGGDDGKVFNIYVAALTADQAATIPGGADSFDELPGPLLGSTFVKRKSGNGTC